MSRCGSCDLYWPSDDRDNFGITCEGNCGAEECTEKLLDLISSLRAELVKAREEYAQNSQSRH